MRFTVHFSRVLIGLLFILSGLIKLNDPTGFSYKLDEYFTVFADDLRATQDSVVTAIKLNKDLEIIKSALQPGDSLFQLTVLQSPWVSKDVFFESTVDVFRNGTSIYSYTVALQDSSDQIGALSCVNTINENQISEDHIALENISGNPTASNIQSDISSYVKNDGWAVNFFNWLRKYALHMAIFVSWLEAILGFAILIGWQTRFTLWMLILITAFFAFLTLYSWMYDKVTDCGCFGDALPMTPKESFYKNVVIGVFIILMYYGRKHIKPIFSNSFGVKILTVLTVLLVGFSTYCYNYLPVVDFLHYSEGSDIRAGMSVPEGERGSDYMLTTYLYKAKDGSGATIQVLYDSDKNTFEPKIDYSKWEYVDVIEEKILEKAYIPPIHDFAFYNADQDNNYIDDFWLEEKKLLLVIHDVKKTDLKAVKEIKDLAKQWKADGYEFWALTASPKEEVEVFRHENQISEFDFYYGDNTNLKSIIRSNPGLILITDTSVVQEVWPSKRLPKYKKILRKSE